MCYALPGPRCSSHAFGVLRDKHEALNDAVAMCQHLENKIASQRSLESRLSGGVDAEQDVVLQNQYQEAVNAELKARGEYYTAQDIYDETPAGQKFLAHNAEVYKDSKPDVAAECQRRQVAGEERRARKFELYKRVNGLQGQDIDESIDTHDDPSTRMARTLGGPVTEETVRHAISTRGKAQVYYRGSMTERHGLGEVMEMSGNRFTVRLGNGEVLERVRGDSLVLT